MHQLSWHGVLHVCGRVPHGIVKTARVRFEPTIANCYCLPYEIRLHFIFLLYNIFIFVAVCICCLRSSHQAYQMVDDGPEGFVIYTETDDIIPWSVDRKFVSVYSRSNEWVSECVRRAHDTRRWEDRWWQCGGWWGIGECAGATLTTSMAVTANGLPHLRCNIVSLKRLVMGWLLGYYFDTSSLWLNFLIFFFFVGLESETTWSINELLGKIREKHAFYCSMIFVW